MNYSRWWILGALILLISATQIGCVGKDVVLDRKEIEETYKLPEGDKAPIFKSEYEYLTPGIHVLEADEDYLWAIGGEKTLKKRILYKSSDLGERWEEFYVFEKPIEGMHITDTGEMLVSISDGRWETNSNCEILKLYGKNFKTVLELESGAALNWNFASDEEGYIFISEYGYKNLPNNARRIYRSKDKGETWENVFSPKEEEGHHNHVISIDKDDPNIIYQVIGDEDKRIIKSEDRGDTWDVLLRDYHPTAELQIDDNIFWALDNVPNSGILRFNKKTEELNYSFETPEPFKGSIYDMLYENGVIYAGLLSYSEPSNYWDGSMFISRDKGETWENFAIWPKLDESSAIGLINFTSKDGYGFINAKVPAIVNGENSHYNGTIKFKLL